MSDIPTTAQTHSPAQSETTTRPRTIAWGTTIAGMIALGLAILVGLTEIADLSIPFRTAGPGAVIVVGVLILLVGLIVVIRSGRRGTADRNRTPGPAQITASSGAPSPSAHSPAAPPPPPVGSSPLDMPTEPSAPQSGPRPSAAADDTPPPPAPSGTSMEDGPAQSSH
ncbi:MAG: hypothetical protein WCA30_19080 [Dermatophilaceae bacterium]